MGLYDDLFEAFGEGILAAWGVGTSQDNPHRTNIRRRDGWNAGYAWGEAHPRDPEKQQDERRVQAEQRFSKAISGETRVDKKIQKSVPSVSHSYAEPPRFTRGKAYDVTKCVRTGKMFHPRAGVVNLKEPDEWYPKHQETPGASGFYNVLIKQTMMHGHSDSGLRTVFLKLTHSETDPRCQYLIFSVGYYPHLFPGDKSSDTSVCSLESFDPNETDYKLSDIERWSEQLPDPPCGHPL